MTCAEGKAADPRGSQHRSPSVPLTFAPTGLGSRSTGCKDSALISESALFRAQGRMSECFFAFAFHRRFGLKVVPT